jgi:hypothetical protein
VVIPVGYHTCGCFSENKVTVAPSSGLPSCVKVRVVRVSFGSPGGDGELKHPETNRMGRMNINEMSTERRNAFFRVRLLSA